MRYSFQKILSVLGFFFLAILSASGQTINLTVENIASASGTCSLNNIVVVESATHSGENGDQVEISVNPDETCFAELVCDDSYRDVGDKPINRRRVGVQGGTITIKLHTGQTYEITLQFKATANTKAKVTVRAEPKEAAIVNISSYTPSSTSDSTGEKIFQIPVTSIVSITYNADDDYVFDRWTTEPQNKIIKDPSISPVSVYVDCEMVVVAKFTRRSKKLVLDANTGGSIPAEFKVRFFQPSSKSKEVTAQIKADPAPGYRFYFWSVKKGNVTIKDSTNADTEVTLSDVGDDGWALEANFEQGYSTDKTLAVSSENATVTVTKESLQFGNWKVAKTWTVKSGESTQIDCGLNDTFRFSREVNSGYEFVQWVVVGASAMPSSSSDSIQLTIKKQITTVRPDIVRTKKKLTVETNTPEQGILKAQSMAETVTTTLTSNRAEMSFLEGDEVTLCAIPEPGHYFTRWTSVPSVFLGTPPKSTVAVNTTITMPAQPLTVTAFFAKLPEVYDLTVEAGKGGAVKVEYYCNHPISGTQNISMTVPAQKTAIYKDVVAGTQIRIKAESLTGYAFDQWDAEPIITDFSKDDVTFAMDSNRTVTARFSQTQYDLKVHVDPEVAYSDGCHVKIGETVQNANPFEMTSINADPPIALLAQASSQGVWTFKGWKMDTPTLITGSNSLQVVMNCDHVVTAVFERSYNLKTSVSPEGSGTVTVSPESLGTVTGGRTYMSGTTVSVTATAAAGNVFSHWTGDLDGIAMSSAANPIAVPMNRDRNLVANMVAANEIKVSVGSATGSVSAFPSLTVEEGNLVSVSASPATFTTSNGRLVTTLHPAASGLDSSGRLAENETVSLSAPSTLGEGKWLFVRWISGTSDGTGTAIAPTASYSFEPVGNTTLMPVYTDQRSLSVKVTLDGSEVSDMLVLVGGTQMTSGSAAKSVTAGVPVALVAPDQSGKIFAGWESVDGGTVTTSDATVTLSGSTASRTIIARYRNEHPLTVGLKTIPSADAVFLPLETCVSAYKGMNRTVALPLATNPTELRITSGDAVLLEAQPTAIYGNKEYRFAGWDTTGDDVPEITSLTTTQTVNSGANIHAVYILQCKLSFNAVYNASHWPDVDITTTAAGTFAPVPDPDSRQYDYGTEVSLHVGATLIAPPFWSYNFWKWTSLPNGAIIPDGGSTVKMDGDKTVIAHYTMGQPRLTVNFNVNGVTNPSDSPPGLSVKAVEGGSTTILSPPALLTKDYNYNNTVVLTASAPTGYVFMGWTDPVVPDSGNALKGTVVMDNNKTAEAVFRTVHSISLTTKTLPEGAGVGGVPSASGYRSELSVNNYTAYYSDQVVYTANPSDGFTFIHWEIYKEGVLADTRTGSPLTYIVNGNQEVRAVYAKNYNLVFKTNPENGQGGTISPSGTRVCYYGQKVDLSVTPQYALEWNFGSWTAPGVSLHDSAMPNNIGATLDGWTEAPASIIVTGPHEIVANFTQSGSERILTVNIRLDGVDNPSSCPLRVKASGSSVPPSTIDPEVVTSMKGGDTKQYYRDNPVKLDATVPSNYADVYAFIAWESESGTNPVRSFDMPPTDKKTVTAVYRTKAKLTMAVSPEGTGQTTPAVGVHDVFVGENISIVAAPADAHIDDKVFSGWTEAPATQAINNPTVAETAITVDGTAKTATAHFEDGHRLEVKVRYETTANTADASKDYATVSGSRTAVATGGGGNRAGIKSSLTEDLVASVLTIKHKETVTIRADAGSSYTFVGWDTDGDDIVDLPGPSSLNVLMDRAKTYTAVFDKRRVKLHVHTHPSNLPAELVGIIRGVAVGPYKEVSTGNPMVYEVFHGHRPNLKAEGSGTDKFNFNGWFHGIGYTGNLNPWFSGDIETVYPDTDGLKYPDTHVTAAYFPVGFHRLIIFTNPEDKIDIRNVNADLLNVAFYEYTTWAAGRPAYVAYVAIGLGGTRVGIHANNSPVPPVDNLGFLRWKPMPGYERAEEWFEHRYQNDTVLAFPVTQSELHIEAIYAPPGGYALTLKFEFTEEGITFNEGEGIYFGDGIFGSVIGSTPNGAGGSLLSTNRNRLMDTAIFEQNHTETFRENDVMAGGPLSVVSWTYQKGAAAPVPRLGGSAFTTDPGVAGQSEIVTANVEVAWKTVSLAPAIFNKPPDWALPSVGTAQFTFLKRLLSHGDTGNPYDVINALAVAPPPTPYLLQYKRVRGGSAPVLTAASAPSGYRFAGWDTNGDGAADFNWSESTAEGWLSHEVWNRWPNAWPKSMQADIVVAPVYIQRSKLELAIETPDNATSKDKVSSSPAVLAVGHVVEGSNEVFVPTASGVYDFNSAFTLTAVPQPYHVVAEWVVEKYKTEGSAVATTEVIPCDGSSGSKTLSVVLDYPTKVTVRFAIQKFNLILNVADSLTGGKRGKVRIVGSSNLDYEVSGSFDYDTRQNIEAVPDSGYLFTGWTVAANGDPPYPDAAAPSNAANPAGSATNVFIDRNKTLTAHFQRAVTLETKTDPESIGTTWRSILTPEIGIHSSIGGSALVDGSSVTIVAGSNTDIEKDYDFIKWLITDDDHPTNAPRVVSSTQETLVLKGNTVATAVYSKLRGIKLSIALTDGAPIPAVSPNDLSVSASPVVRYGSSTLNVSGVGGNGEASIRESDTINIVASPGTHYEFDHWEISVGGIAQDPNPTTPSLALSANGDIVAKAVFKPKNYTLTVTIDPASSSIPVASLLGGSSAAATHNFLNVASWSLPYGSTVKLTTAPAEHYRFEGWQDGGAVLSFLPESQNECSLVLTGDKTIKAVFVRSEYILTYTIAPTGKGSITLADDTPLAPTSVHPAGSTVKVKAVDNASTVFDKWNEGDIDGAATVREQELLMNKDRNIVANFKDAVTLTVNRSPDDDAYGTVSIGNDTPPRWSSGNVHTFAVDDPVHLLAVPSNVHHLFDGWIFAPQDSQPEGVDASLASITFDIAKATNATGTFSRKTYTLNVAATKAGVSVEASVVATKLVADEGQTAEHDFLMSPSMSRLYSPTAVKLEAVAKVSSSPGPRYRFNKWADAQTGALVSSSATTNFVFDKDASLNADFIRQFQVTINKGQDRATYPTVVYLDGTVTPVPGSYLYDVGGAFTVTATAPAGYDFVGWLENVSGARTSTVADDKRTATLEFDVTDALADGGDLSITPTFARKHYPIVAKIWDKSSNSEGGGTVSILAPMQVDGEYYHFDQVTVVLDSIRPGYRFVGWDVDGNFIADTEGTVNGAGQPVYIFNVDGAKTIHAIVTRVYTLALTADPSDKSLGSVLVVGAQGNKPPVPMVGGFKYEFDHGTRVAIKAEPNPEVSSAFDLWYGNVELGGTYSMSATVEMNDDQSVAGKFKIVEKCNLTLSVPEGGGKIVLRVNGDLKEVLSGTSFTFSFVMRATVMLQAFPNPGFSFASWTPDSAVSSFQGGSQPIVSVEMNESKSIQAHFGIRQYVLTTKASPVDAGTAVALTPGPHPYVNGNPAVVGIQAAAKPGWEFEKWDFDDSTSLNHQVEVAHDRTVTALFKKVSGNATLNVLFDPVGSGSWTCEASKEANDPENTFIIKVTANPGYVFEKWLDYEMVYGEGLPPGQAKIMLVGERAYEVRVKMKKQEFILVPNTSPSDESGLSIIAYVPGALPGPPQEKYDANTTVILSAESTNPGYEFHMWNEDASGNAPTTRLLMDDDKYVVANFKKKPRQYLLRLSLHPDSVSDPADSLFMQDVSEKITASGVHSLSRVASENESVKIGYNLTSPSLYGFAEWSNVSNQYLCREEGGSATLLATNSHTVYGRFYSLKRLLRTEAYTMGVAPDPDSLACNSKGGSIELSRTIGTVSEEITIKAYPELGFKFESWEVSPQVTIISSVTDEERSYITLTIKTNTGSDDVRVRVYFKMEDPDGKPPPSVLNIHHEVGKTGDKKITIEGKDQPLPGHIILDKNSTGGGTP